MKQFPLTLIATEIGLLAALFFGLLSYSFLVGLSVFVLFVAVGATWRRDDPPIFPFILAYQWGAVSIGFLYYHLTGIYPSAYATGDIEKTVWLSLLGLLCLTVGIRLGQAFLERWVQPRGEEHYVANLRGLFKLVLALYAIDYVLVINTKAFGGFDVILERVVAFRQVFLMLLWFEALRRKTHRHYVLITLAWVFVPLLGSYFSDFKMPWFMLLIVYGGLWRPWERGFWRLSVPQFVMGAGVAAMVVFLAMVWQAGVKRETRAMYDRELVARDPVTRVQLFLTNAANAVPIVFNDTQTVVEGLVSRLSYITFFSRVIEYVPGTQPHTNGELLQMAVTNTAMPRFLFPAKPVLPSDSYYTRRFTGILVADEGTSISIGYMAEFYADWGINGMFVSILGYGLLMGLASSVIRIFVKPALLVPPVLVAALMVVYQFEHQFIKTFAALNLSVVALIGLTMLTRKRLVRWLRIAPVGEAEQAPQAPGPPARRGYPTLPRPSSAEGTR